MFTLELNALTLVAKTFCPKLLKNSTLEIVLAALRLIKLFAGLGT